MLDLRFWETEWPVIAGAPHLVFGGAIVLAIALIGITFLFAKMFYRRQATISEQRRQLASEQQTAVTRELEQVKAENVDLKNRINAGAPGATLAPIAERMTLIIERAANANTALGTTLGVTQGIQMAPLPPDPKAGSRK
jgi:hypothetical protein